MVLCGTWPAFCGAPSDDPGRCLRRDCTEWDSPQSTGDFPMSSGSWKRPRKRLGTQPGNDELMIWLTWCHDMSLNIIEHHWTSLNIIEHHWTVPIGCIYLMPRTTPFYLGIPTITGRSDRRADNSRAWSSESLTPCTGEPFCGWDQNGW